MPRAPPAPRCASPRSRWPDPVSHPVTTEQDGLPDPHPCPAPHEGTLTGHLVDHSAGLTALASLPLAEQAAALDAIRAELASTLRQAES